MQNMPKTICINQQTSGSPGEAQRKAICLPILCASSERTATVCYKATQRFTHRNSHSHAIVVIKRFATIISWYCMKEFTQGGSHTSVTPAIIHFPNQHIFSLIRDLCTLFSLKNVKFVKRSSNRVNMPGNMKYRCTQIQQIFSVKNA